MGGRDLLSMPKTMARSFASTVFSLDFVFADFCSYFFLLVTMRQQSSIFALEGY